MRIAVIKACAALAVWPPIVPLNAVVNFDDTRLKAAVLRALGKDAGPVTDAELAGLAVLEAPFHGIVSLGGLEGADSLTRLGLFGNAIQSASPLAGLTGLEDLDLGGNQLDGVSALAGLVNLRRLRLDLNGLGDLSMLAPLVALQDLSIAGNRIESLGFLAGMNGLQLLNAASNKISHAGALAVSCPLLVELDLSGNRLESAAFVDSLPDLAMLDLAGNFLVEAGWPSGGPTVSAVPGQWHHLALVIDGGTSVAPDALRVYVDGNLLDSVPGSQLWSHGADIGIGGVLNQTRFPDSQPDGDGYGFNGRIDDLRIHHRALSAPEVEALSSGSGPSDTAVWWKFDGDFLDSAGTNHGTAVGNAAFGNGLFGQALVVDGSGDAVSIPDSSDINLRESPAYTVSLFFRTDSVQPGRAVLYEQGGRARGLNLYLSDGRVAGGAWNDEPDESAWAGEWIGDATAGFLERLNLTGNQLESLPPIPAGSRPADWTLSHNRLSNLDDLTSLSGPGTLRVEGNFFDPAALPGVATLKAAGIDVFGERPSSYIDFATWRQSRFSPAESLDDAVGGPLADPDRDGLPNLLECAFGGNPLRPDSGAVAPVQTARADGTLVLRFRDFSPEILLEVRESGDLQPESWTGAAGTLTRDATNSGWLFETAPPAGGRVFLRLSASAAAGGSPPAPQSR